MTLSPVIPPLSRELKLEEWHIGLMISIAALMVVATSQFWGRRSQSHGRRPVLITALVGLVVAMICFTGFSAAGMSGLLTGIPLLLGLLITRGFLFGGSLAGVVPTAQAFIANVTTTETARVKGMAGIGSAQGLALVVGSVVGGVLAKFGLLVSIGAVPFLLLGALGLAFFVLQPEERTALIQDPPRISPLDHRVTPFLLAGFAMFMALGFIQFLAGFLIQDRYGLDGETTGLMTGLTVLCAGVMMIISQAMIVPRSNWSPTTLLRVGIGIGLIGCVGFALHGPIWLLMASVGVIGGGIGMAMPGYTAGPSLLLTQEEQGSLAGLIAATNALTFVIAPIASTSLYGIWPDLPAYIGVGIMVLALVLVLFHPRFSHMPTAPRE